LIAAIVWLGFTAAVQAAEPAPGPQDVIEGDGAPRDATLAAAQSGFALRKLDVGAGQRALVVPASAGTMVDSHLKAGLRAPQDSDLVGLQSPGAFRAAPVRAMIDPAVVQTSGEFPLESAKTAMLPLPPPSALRDGRNAVPLPRADAIENPEQPSRSARPRPAAGDGSSDLSAAEKCQSARSLKSISSITAYIGVKPDDVEMGLPPECSLGDERVEPRHWRRTIFTWTAAATWHKPVYFEDEQLDRYGHTFGPVTQTTVSAVKFFATVPLVPYYMGVYPPRECVYDLGTYRPGDCCPYYLDPFPLSVRGAVNEMYLGILPAL
jgi:hypothetical protein